jgi:hypothetical protein
VSRWCASPSPARGGMGGNGTLFASRVPPESFHVVTHSPTRELEHIFSVNGKQPASKVYYTSRVWLPSFQIPRPRLVTHHTSHSLLVGPSQSQSQNRTALWLVGIPSSRHLTVTGRHQRTKLWLAGLPCCLRFSVEHGILRCTVENCHFPGN